MKSLVTFGTLPSLLLVAVGVVAMKLRQHDLDRALIGAVRRHDISGAASLLQSGANANTTDRPEIHRTLREVLVAIFHGGSEHRDPAVFYPSALQLAVGGGEIISDSAVSGNMNVDDSEIVRALLDHGARLDPIDQEHTTPLMNALARNRLLSANLLIQRGADVRAESGNYGDDGANVWQAGHELMQQSPELLGLVIARGANVNARVDIHDGHRGSPLFAITEGRGDSDQAAADVHALLKAGADPNHVLDGVCETPLAWAAWNAGPKVGQVLLNHGARINQATAICGTPLHWANVLLAMHAGLIGKSNAPRDNQKRIARLKAYIAFLKRHGAIDRRGRSSL